MSAVHRFTPLGSDLLGHFHRSDRHFGASLLARQNVTFGISHEIGVLYGPIVILTRLCHVQLFQRVMCHLVGPILLMQRDHAHWRIRHEFPSCDAAAS